MSVNRDVFIKAMISSLEVQQELEKEVGASAVAELSPAALARLDESALAGAEDFTFDFPAPTAADAIALAKALGNLTSAKPRPSLFAREFVLSKRFLDGLTYCISKHGAVEDGPGLGAGLAAEIGALVLVKCVRALLVDPALAATLLRDEGLDVFARPPPPAQQPPPEPPALAGFGAAEGDGQIERPTETPIEEGAVEGQRGDGSAISVIAAAGSVADEEVWAAEPDDDDYVYEAYAPAQAHPAGHTPIDVASEGAYGREGGQRGRAGTRASPRDLRRRFAGLLGAFNASALSALPAASHQSVVQEVPLCPSPSR